MDGLIDVLYALPILGHRHSSSIGYLVAIVPLIAPIFLRSATPLALGPCAGS